MEDAHARRTGLPAYTVKTRAEVAALRRATSKPVWRDYVLDDEEAEAGASSHALPLICSGMHKSAVSLPRLPPPQLMHAAIES